MIFPTKKGGFNLLDLKSYNETAKSCVFLKFI